MKKSYIKRSTLILVVFIAIAIPTLSGSFSISKNELKIAQARTDLEGIKVSVYYADESIESSRVALINMFNWMNATVDTFDSTDILSGSSIDCDVLVFPGGGTYSFRSSIGEEGLEKIRLFISNGGSFFGICGGAVFGASILDLVEGRFAPMGPEAGRGTYIMEMPVNNDSTGPDLSNEPNAYSTLYWESMYYASDDMEGIIPILSYPQNSEPAMISSKYGSGTVFLCGPHPEYEENSDRDGVSDFDHLDDPDSEWPLLLKVALWLVEASPDTSPDDSPTTDPNPWIPIIIGLAIFIPLAVGGLGVAIFILKRRM
jgi:glutamine amidotransferase-like uncharacterized protein